MACKVPEFVPIIDRPKPKTTRKIKVIIPGQVRSKKNSRQGFRGRNLPSKAYLRWEKDAFQNVWLEANKIRADGIRLPISDPVRADFRVYLGKGSILDLSNAIQGPEDMLTPKKKPTREERANRAAGGYWPHETTILEDDDQIYALTGRVYRDRENPRVEITIRW